MVQGTWIVNQVVYSSRGGAQAHHGERYCFRNRRRDRSPQAGQGAIGRIRRICRKRKPGRPAKVAFIEAPKVQKARKRRKMSAEGRERIRQAQIKRWAALNASKANMNTTVAPLPRRRRSLQRLLDWLLRGMQSIPQPIQRSAARQSREGTSFILARLVWECQSTRNCLVDGLILRAAPKSGKRARWQTFGE